MPLKIVQEEEMTCKRNLEIAVCFLHVSLSAESKACKGVAGGRSTRIRVANCAADLQRIT